MKQRLFQLTNDKLARVRDQHKRLEGHLADKKLIEEQTLFDRIEEAVSIGCKKGIMTQERMRELCDEYLDLFGGRHP